MEEKAGERAMKQAERREKTREEIQRAFMVLVSERGFDRVSVKDICLRADINRNTFYLHYTDKDDLAHAILDRLIAAQAREVMEEASHISRSAPEKIEQIVRSMMQMLDEEREFYRIFLTDEGLARHVRPLRQLAYSMVIGSATRAISPIAADFVVGGVVEVFSTFLAKGGENIDATASKLSRLLACTFEELHPD